MPTFLRRALRALVVCPAFFSLISLPLAAELREQPVLLPQVQRLDWQEGVFRLDQIRVETPVQALQWEEALMEMGAECLPEAAKTVRVRLVDRLPGTEGLTADMLAEAYVLRVRPHQVEVEACTAAGAYWALQTLRQLARDGDCLPACEITDWPAFRIRGFMQDVGRTYISVDELMREIDYLSRFKINVFHWHLTENQAWRLESKVYPALNDSLNILRQPGRYYTLQEARDLVDFCKARHVTLIPEIDMPGHSEAFRRTFGHDMQSPEGMAILKDLVKEACETFDVPYFHIGTDEVAFTNPTFVPEMVAFVRSLGKKVISWNPGWKYKAGEVDMTQLWSYRGRPTPGIPAIDCRFHYINHFDTFGDLVALYNSRIYNQTQGDDQVAGVIMALWNDRYIDDEWKLVAQNNVYPSLLAAAERAWLGGGTQYFDGPGVLLPTDASDPLFQNFADFERRLSWHRDHTFAGEPFAYVRQTGVRWHITDPFPNEGDLARAFPPEDSLSRSYVYQGKTYGVRPAVGAGIYLRHVWGNLVPAFYKDPQPNHTAYAYTYVYSPQDQEVGLWLEFQNYSRSESDLPPLPGTWDYKGSRAWLNGQEILPPVWTATHRERDNEIPLGNENCTARSPLLVELKKGWNKVLLKLPVGEFQGPQTRLVKWMFTAVFVYPDGRGEAQGLRYSPVK